MNSKSKKEEFYYNNETDEFHCENYFLNENFYMKESNIQEEERENLNETYAAHNYHELGLNNEKISQNVSYL